MAQILGLQILCVGFLLIGAGCEGGSSPAALSDSESYIDECKWFKCPEPEATECPADSSIDEFVGILLNPLDINHDTRAKRDLQSKCCGMPRCRCNKCPTRPQCKADEVLIELSQGNGQPGNCCTQYRCGKEPQCEDGESALIYWPDKCTKCNSCKPPCIDICYQSDESSPSNCLTDDKEIKFNDDIWFQGHGCVKCVCSEGQSLCQESSCKPAECKNPVKLPDVCCPVCLEEISSSTTAGTPTTAANATTEAAVVQSSATTQKIIESATEKHVKEGTSTISSSTSESFEETTETTELPEVEETTEKSIEIEIPEIVNTDTDSLETETTEDLLSSTSAPATSTTLNDEVEQETTVTAMDDPELEISSSSTYTTSSTSSSSALTTERPEALSTSAPSALTPESTSWHSDLPIEDSTYRMASPNGATHTTNLTDIMYVLIAVVVIIIVIIIIIILFNFIFQRRKKMYSSVPHSDCNLSENTNTSDLV
ncbi:mucin-5AC [Drosophila innubila]|uniref:mucin-5AC n=1 Tax=Drosophila innubila TaxID=198719 RepID=UPI00148E4E95|nr:mucin-5AC [Drosophila innubila]